MGKRRGAPLKHTKLTVREASILQRNDDRRLFPRNPYLLQCVVEALLHRIEQLDKTKGKNKANEARALLWLLARHEARLLTPSLELFLEEPIPESFLEAMSSSPGPEFVPEHVKQDIEIGRELLGNATIQRQLRGLKGSHSAHEHLPESLTIQRKIVIDYFEKRPLPPYQETSDEAKKRMRAWVDEHLPILMPQLKGIPCLCGFYEATPIELPDPHSIGHAADKKTSDPTKFLYGYPDSDILLLLLSHLHQSRHRKSKPSQIGKLLKLFRTPS